MSYFDHNATTPIDSQVLEAMLPYLKENFGNPSSLHKYGRLARTAINRARQQVASLVNARPEQVIFTSCGTEANNLALKGNMHLSSKGCIGMSVIEHASILDQIPFFKSQGWSVDLLPTDKQGLLCFKRLNDFLRKKPQLLTVMAANNESGVLQDIPRIASLARQQDCLLHVDASQFLGKATLDFSEIRADMLTLSAHKIYGPKGVGALIVNDSVNLLPLINGGGHELGKRSGTENVSSIVGFGKAAELAQKNILGDIRRQRKIRDNFESSLLRALPEATFFSRNADRLPNTSFFSLPGWHGESVVMQLDQQGFSVSSGSACESDVDDPSHVLRAMNIPDEIALGAVRVSFGRSNTELEVSLLVQAIINLTQQSKTHNSLVDW